MSWRANWSCTAWVAFAIAAGAASPTGAQTVNACDASTVAAKQAEFRRLVALKRFNPGSVSDVALRSASLEYVRAAEGCYASLVDLRPIDDGPLMPGADDQQSGFQTSGSKWGMGNLYGSGADVNGPGKPGGTVSFSFMATGTPMGTHSDANLAISGLPGYQACFVSAIRDAFAAWSAVANIQFVEVPDNGVVFDGAGARGDIRIGAHTMDGQWGVLAHAFFPPPGGVSAAGDMHFDRSEPWACAPGPGVVDIGIVATHEIGHAIGLNHETRLDRTALMNPYYNPTTAPMLLADDVAGASAIYGVGVAAADDLLVNFGQQFGLWELDYGTGWRLLNNLSPKQTVSGDLDGNGIRDQIVAFPEGHGTYVRWNNGWWSKIHFMSPGAMATGNFDGDGRTDIAINFTGFGVWILYNGSTWKRISTSDVGAISVGDVDGAGTDDIVATLPGQGVWTYLNDSAWVRIHPNDADLIAVAPVDAATGPRDIILQIPRVGLYQLTNFSSWSFLTGLPVTALTAAQVDGDTRGELVVDFGPELGVWMLWNGVRWTWLHNLTAQGLSSGDLDGNGQDDIIVRFGESAGLWMFVNGSSWVQAHPFRPVDVTVAEVK